MSVPAQLLTAIDNAAATYGVNPTWLVRIWQFESGNTYPNPAVNSSGCGGLFGLCQGSSSIDPSTGASINLLSSGTTQAQANAAAYTLSRLINRFGNIYDAMVAYSGGSANEATFVSGITSKINPIVNTIVSTLKAFYSSVVTQPFGPTGLTLEPAYNGYAHFHQGIDLGVTSGTAVPALTSGIVSNIVTGCIVGNTSCGSGYGNQVWVTLSDGSQVLYGHLSQVMTSIGATITQGQQIGLSGNTGDSTGPHLHLGLLSSAGKWIDPSSLIQSVTTGNINLSNPTSNTLTSSGASIVGGVLSTGFGDLFGKIGSSFDPTSLPSKFITAIGSALKTYFTLGLFLDPLFVGMGLLFITIGAIGIVLGHGDSGQTIKYVGKKTAQAATVAAAG